MSEGLLDLLREGRRCAADGRKVFLALYGLLLTVPLALLVVAAARAAIGGSFPVELQETFLRPVQATGDLFSDAYARGAWGLLASAVLGVWLLAHLVASFFGLAITRMVAVEIATGRRADLREALAFAKGHWYWQFLTPASLLLAGLFLLALGVAFVLAGRAVEWLLVVSAPPAFALSIGAAFLLLGLAAGGILSAPAIATEWSDAFDAVTRVYGYSFTRAYRLLLYRAGGGLALVLAVTTRGLRVVLVLALFYGVLLVGLGPARARGLFDAILLEAPAAPPLPQTLAAWTVLATAAIYATYQLARVLVFRLAVHQIVYLLLRRHVDRVPLRSIDGYRPDRSSFDPAAQGFEIVEVEEELSAESE